MSMHRGRQITLHQMNIGQTGTVVTILGGRRLMQRLEGLGIRPGKKVTKITSSPFHGPVTLRVNNTQIAVGFGMANRIVVQLDRYLHGDTITR